MLRKSAIALTALLVFGLPSIALAEDSSSSFDGRLRAMTARAWGGYGGYYGGVYGSYYPFATSNVGLYRNGYGYGHVARYRGWGRRCCY